MNQQRTLALVTSLFFMWGFLTCMNDILIPYLKGVFELNYFKAMLVQFAFFSAYFVGSLIYFVISITHGDPINKMGYKNGIVTGLVIAGCGALLFYPAAQMVSYPFFLTALFVLALGFTLLQISANPYVAILGDESAASSRLNLAQGFNSFGTTIAPLIGGFLIFRLFSEGAVGADSVKTPYLVFSSSLFLLAVLMKIAPLPEFKNEEKIVSDAGALKHSHLVFGIVAIFMYVGGEVSIGSILISFLGLEEIAGFNEDEASTFLAFYWGGLMIGRFLGAISLSAQSTVKKLSIMAVSAILTFAVIIGAVLMKDNKLTIAEFLPFVGLMVLNFIAFIVGKSMAGRTLFVFAIGVVALLLVTIFGTGSTAFWAIIGIGLFNSIMWSNIFTLAIAKLGNYTSQGSSLLVMAVIGGAILPPIQGAFADAWGVQLSFVVPIIAYLYIAWYGAIGCQVSKINA